MQNYNQSATPFIENPYSWQLDGQMKSIFSSFDNSKMSSVMKGRSQIIEQENVIMCESAEGPYGGINIPGQVQQNVQEAAK